MARIRHEDRADARWIFLEGELDQVDVLQFKPAFDEAVREGTGNVVLDLGGVSFLGTLGIGLIGWAQDEVEKRDSTLKLSRVPRFIEKTLKTMNLDELFERV